MKFSTINPATEEKIADFDTMAKTDVLAILKKTHDAFTDWKQTSTHDRAKLFRNLADVLRKNKQKYAALITKEMGKPIKESLAEVEKCAWTCEVYAEHGPAWLLDKSMSADGIKHLIVFEPLGVILAVMPWNYPFWQALRFGIPTLMAGNGALLKHASNVPECAMAIEDAFSQARFPKNLFRTVFTDHSTIAEFISSPLIRGISLTGSTPAGKRIAELAGKNLKKVVLELGGSDPFIVLDDADIDKAAKNAALGRFMNAGQSCIASKRFIVMEKIASAFTEKFKEEVKKKIVGDPASENTAMGPLVNKDGLLGVEEQVIDALAKGGKVVLGGKRREGKGFYYEPTIITNVTADMRITKEEVFGPVAPIIPVKNLAEAVAIANSLEFGLGGSIWTKDLMKGEEIARRITAGAVFVNSITKSDPRMPFGGVKESGLGRELGEYGLKEFVNIKSINIYEG